MHKRCYGSVKVFWLDRDKAIEQLRSIAERIKREKPEVSAIYLFGSLAEGRATPRSDADLIILLKTSREKFLDRPLAFMEYFSSFSLAVDLFCYTEQEAEKNPFVKRALEGALKLA